MTINIKKMQTEYNRPIRYFLETEEGPLLMNPLIGRTVSIRFGGEIRCVVCGKRINKTFAQGSCYDCFRNAPENAECIIRPELCRAHLGEGRDPAWEKIHHDRPHYVYLALSSAVKVGVTREDQIPTRWIDQGASQGLILARWENRYLAGVMEVALKEHFTDRTNWQRMLKNQISDENLAEVKDGLRKILPEEFSRGLTDDRESLVLDYPVLSYPEKLKSLKLDREPVVEGVLEGIKGQYLIFQGGRVLNVRAHGGYKISFTF